MDAQERKRRLVSTAMDVAAKQALDYIPDSGSFSPTWVQMNHYAAGYDGYLRIEHSKDHGCAIRASQGNGSGDIQLRFLRKQAGMRRLAEE